MRTPNAQMIVDAANLISGVDHVLGNTHFYSQLSAKDCYEFASKLERAVGLLIAVGNRKTQESINNDAVEIF
jgi:hypothetical protein